MKSMKKTIALAVAIAMICGCAIGGTLAWLIDQTTEVQNTFTVGNIDIELTETWNTDSDKNGENDAWQGKMVPGATLAKDPKVTVDSSSENCWLFVKVEEKAATLVAESGATSEKALDYFISYDMATGWTALEGEEGVYYRTAEANDSFDVLANNQVTVNQAVVKDDMDALERSGAELPQLVFTAYAVQSANLTDQNNDSKVDAADAWLLAPKE